MITDVQTAAPSVLEVIRLVKRDIGAIGKTQRNTDQNFNFRGIDDVMIAAHGPMLEHGLLVIPTVLRSRTHQYTSKSGTLWNRVRLTVRYTFYGPLGDMITATVASEGADMSDKATGKAMSAAFKAAFLQTLGIPTKDTADPDKSAAEAAERRQERNSRNSIEDESQRGAMQQEQRSNGRQNGAQAATEQKDGPAPIREDQIPAINTLLPRAGMTLKDLLESLQITGLRQLSANKANVVIERLTTKAAEREPKTATPATTTQETTLLIEQQRVRLKLGGIDWKALVRARNGGLTLEQMQPPALVTFLAWLRKQDTEGAKAFIGSPDAWHDADEL